MIVSQNAVSKLRYVERFGSGAEKLAKASLSVAATSSDAEIAAARYTRWFRGEDGQPEPMASSSRKFREITSSMVAAEVAAATKENLSILGDDASRLFTSRLPAGHKLRKAIRSTILPNIPYLGSCKFGEVITAQSEDRLSVTQVFITNFDCELDTTDGASFYKPVSRDFDQMFFGVHLLVDRFGNPLGFDRDRGRKGIAFKTKDITTALYNIASASTGMSVEALQARTAAAKKAARR